MISVALRHVVWALLLFSWCFEVSASSASSHIYSKSISTRSAGWECPDTDDDFAAVRLEVGYAVMSKNEASDADFIHQSLGCLKELWIISGEGELRAEVSDAYLVVLNRFPTTTLRFFLKEPDLFSEWLKNLQSRSFVWGRPPPCGLESFRLDVISSLERSSPALRTERSLKTRLMRELRKIRCKQVD